MAAEASPVNQLTPERVAQLMEKHRQRLQRVGLHACEVPLSTKGTPMASKGDGYVQVSVKIGGRKVKVLWHQLAWRAANNFALCPPGLQIAHRCGRRNCGRASHLVAVPRAVNEEHKMCQYVRLDGAIYLVCQHVPHCLPDNNPAELTPVDAAIVARMMQ